MDDTTLAFFLGGIFALGILIAGIWVGSHVFMEDRRKGGKD